MKKKERGYWQKWANVEATLREVEKRIGKFPTYQDLQKNELASLANVIVTKYDGMQAVRARMNVDANRYPRGHWLIWENVEKKMRELEGELGHCPSHKELRDKGLSRLSTTILKVHGGTEIVQQRLKMTAHEAPKNHWQKWENIEIAVRELEKKLGRIPNTVDLSSSNLNGALQAIQRHFDGWAAVSKRLGYDPVSDMLIAQNADNLARIILILRVPTDKLWLVLKSRWVTRDLTAAIEEFSRNGSVDRFRDLLDMTS